MLNNSKETMFKSVDEICQNFIDRNVKIGIIGLGYVGLPLACAACSKGFKVFGFDTDHSKIEKLSKGISYIGNIHNDKIKKFVDEDLFRPVEKFSKLADMDAIIMCVPTPLNKSREPDLYCVTSATKTIAEYLRHGQLIVLESTTYPGTTDEVLRPILEEKSGLKSGVDFYLSFSPEREDPGNPVYHTATIPKIIGGDTADTLKIAKTMYDQFLEKTVPVSSNATSEAVKITENIFRSVNIALVNELKLIYERMGIDIWEVVNAASTKPFGYMPFYPGPGLGGHCIPIDPFYLTWKAREFNINTKFIELAGEINRAMPEHVVSRAAEALDINFGKAINGSKVLIMGMAYKKNVADDRESPAYMVLDLFVKRKANVIFHDPFVHEIPRNHEYPQYTGMKSTPLTKDLVQEQDLVVIVTDHTDIDYKMLAENAKLIVDTRNSLKDIKDRSNIIKA